MFWGQVRSDARPYPGVRREVEVLAIFKQSSKFLRFLRELTNVACRDQKVMGWKWSRCTPTLLDVHARGDFQLRQKIWTTNATIWSPWGHRLQIKAYLGWDWWLHLPDDLENESLTISTLNWSLICCYWALIHLTTSFKTVKSRSPLIVTWRVMTLLAGILFKA